MAFFDIFKNIGSGIKKGFGNVVSDFSSIAQNARDFGVSNAISATAAKESGPRNILTDKSKNLLKQSGFKTDFLGSSSQDVRQQQQTNFDQTLFASKLQSGSFFSNPAVGRVRGSSVRSALPSGGVSGGGGQGSQPSRRRGRGPIEQRNIRATQAVGGQSDSQSFSGAQQAPATSGGGGSAFTGLLGAASGVFGPNVAEASDEDPRFTDLRRTQGIQGKFSMAQQQAILGLQQPGLQSLQTEGPVQAGSQGLAPPPSDRLNSSLPQEIPADSLTSQPSSNFTSLIGSGQVTREQFKLEVENLAAKIRQELEAKQPTPEDPVVDTPEVLEFIQNSDDPFGVAQAIDDYKRANTNLFELETERVNLKKDIQAIQESYRAITKDIKDNPDLPKGLAQRRLAQLNEQQGEALLGFVNQLELLDDQVQSENELVNRQFNLITTLQQQQRQSSQDAFQRLQFILDAGATVSDESLRDLAERAGVDFNSAKSVLKQAQEENKPANLEGLRSTTIGGFELLTDAEGNVIKTQKVSKSKGDAQFTPGEKRTINRLPQLKQFSPDFQGLLFESLTDAEISEFVKFYDGKKTTSEGAGLSPSPSIALDEFIITKEFSDPFDRLLNEARGGLN